jgi:aminocarboxymuconate-semialdehyde decarboxylase
MKIDIYTHCLPKKYVKALHQKKKEGADVYDLSQSHTDEIDIKLKLSDMYPDMVHVLTVALPPLETEIVSPSVAIELARIANDEMAEIVAKHPDRFIAAVACLPLNDIDASLKEAERAITQLHFKGVQIFTNINRKPLDTPRFRPLYGMMAHYDLPIWIHPWLRPKPAAGDLLTNPVVGLGWPFETTVAMGCLANSGVFEDYPNIKFITHHCGGMVPFFARRIAMKVWEKALTVTDEQRTRVVANFHKFYADTAVYGNSAALMCGYDYFGADHLLFGTDTPLGGAESQTRLETIQSIEQMDIPAIDKDKIFERNASRLLKMGL